MVDVATPAPPGATATTTGQDTRARLIEAAVEVFLANGYARTRVQDIAKRAGLTTGAMYAHFENKAALLSEAIAQYGEGAIAEVFDVLEDDEADDGIVGVAIGVDLLTGPTEPVHRLILEALAVSARGEEPVDLIGPALDRMRMRIRNSIVDIHDDGRIESSVDDDALVALLQRLILGSIVAKAVELPKADPRASEELVAMFLSAIGPAQDD